jgi:hypothetical protein
MPGYPPHNFESKPAQAQHQDNKNDATLEQPKKGICVDVLKTMGHLQKHYKWTVARIQDNTIEAVLAGDSLCFELVCIKNAPNGDVLPHHCSVHINKIRSAEINNDGFAMYSGLLVSPPNVGTNCLNFDEVRVVMTINAKIDDPKKGDLEPPLDELFNRHSYTVKAQLKAFDAGTHLKFQIMPAVSVTRFSEQYRFPPSTSREQRLCHVEDFLRQVSTMFKVGIQYKTEHPLPLMMLQPFCTTNITNCQPLLKLCAITEAFRKFEAGVDNGNTDRLIFNQIFEVIEHIMKDDVVPESGKDTNVSGKDTNVSAKQKFHRRLSDSITKVRDHQGKGLYEASFFINLLIKTFATPSTDDSANAHEKEGNVPPEQNVNVSGKQKQKREKKEQPCDLLKQLFQTTVNKDLHFRKDYNFFNTMLYPGGDINEKLKMCKNRGLHLRCNQSKLDLGDLLRNPRFCHIEALYIDGESVTEIVDDGLMVSTDSKLKSVHLHVPRCTSIGNNFFKNSTSLESVIFKENHIRTIGNNYLQGCSHLIEYRFEGLTDVEKFGEGCLSSCDKLEYVDLRKVSKLECIASDCLSNNKVLQHVYFARAGLHLVPDNDPVNKSENDPDRNLVTTIGENFLKDCPMLSSFHMNVFSNLISVGTGLLGNCHALRTFNISNLTQLKGLPDDSLSNCHKLVKAILCSRRGKNKQPEKIYELATIGNNVFQNCKSLTVIDSECLNKLATIGNNYCEGSDNLVKFNLKNVLNVKNIGKAFVANCPNLSVIGNLEYFSIFASKLRNYADQTIVTSCFGGNRHFGVPTVPAIEYIDELVSWKYEQTDDAVQVSVSPP